MRKEGLALSYAMDSNDTATCTLPGDSMHSLAFNVMADRTVREELFPKEYVLGPRRIACRFDRAFRPDSPDSPSHLLFLSCLVQLQRMLYISLCHEFGFEYEPGGTEHLKIWPTRLKCDIPRIIREHEDLVHDLRIVWMSRRSGSSFEVGARSTVGSMSIRSQALVVLLTQPSAG